MAEMMLFPETVDEFMEQYKVVDTDHVYTNGTEFVPIFRMRQWFEHLSTGKYITKEKAKELVCDFCQWNGTENCKECEHPVDDVPAADVGPVRHGRWRLYSPLTDTYECDKCGYQVIDESFRTNYCPNCGAKMEVTD